MGLCEEVLALHGASNPSKEQFLTTNMGKGLSILLEGVSREKIKRSRLITRPLRQGTASKSRYSGKRTSKQPSGDSCC